MPCEHCGWYTSLEEVPLFDAQCKHLPSPLCTCKQQLAVLEKRADEVEKMVGRFSELQEMCGELRSKNELLGQKNEHLQQECDELLAKLRGMKLQQRSSRSPREGKMWSLNEKDIAQNKPQLYFCDGSLDVFYAILCCFKKCKLGSHETRLKNVNDWWPKLQAWWTESCAFFGNLLIGKEKALFEGMIRCFSVVKCA